MVNSYDQQDSAHRAGYKSIQALAEQNEKLILEGLKQIPDSITNAVMVLGPTGSGKSTLINLLAGKPLFSRTKDNSCELILDSKDMLPGITIGHNLLSETSIPHGWVHNGNTIYWDCPGFNDNRRIEHEIANAFLIKKLFDIYKTCKILLVVSETDVNERRAIKLLSLVKSLDLFFQSNIKKIRSGLLLVVSGANPNKTAIHIQGTIQSIIDTQELALTDPQKEILQAFINNPIIIFKKPVVEGTFDTTCATKYLQTIGNLGVIKDLYVKSIVTPHSSLVVLESYTNLLRSINLEINALMSSLRIQMQNYIAKYQKSQDPQEIRKTVIELQAISFRLSDKTILSNQQLLEIVQQCMQHNMQSLTNLKNILHKTEIFDFLEQFVEHDAKVRLGIQTAITRYLSNCTRDANSAIQAIEQQRLEHARITLQFKLQREAAATLAAEKRAAETAKAVQAAKQALTEATHHHQDRPKSIVKRIGRSIFGW